MKDSIISLLVLTMTYGASAIWIEPLMKPRLVISRAPSSVLAAGRTTLFTCTGVHLTADTTTLHWFHRRGVVEIATYVRGRSPLSINHTVSEKDGRSSLLCQNTYFSVAARPHEQKFPWRMATYFIQAESDVILPDRPLAKHKKAIARQSVHMQWNANATQRAGEQYRVTCRTSGMTHAAIDVWIRKDGRDMKLYSSWQHAGVSLMVRLLPEDHGASLLCRAWTTGRPYHVYSIPSNTLSINLSSSQLSTDPKQYEEPYLVPS